MIQTPAEVKNSGTTIFDNCYGFLMSEKHGPGPPVTSVLVDPEFERFEFASNSLSCGGLEIED